MMSEDDVWLFVEDARAVSIGEVAKSLGCAGPHRVTSSRMSTRGTHFLCKWISNNVPDDTSSDMLAVAELVQKLFADAAYRQRYPVVLEAIVHQQGGS